MQPLHVREVFHRYKLRLLAAVVLALLAAAVATSPTYRLCMADAQPQPAPQFDTLYESAASPGVAGRILPCVGEVVSANEPMITALSTAFVAIFTIVLAHSTSGLWRETARLARGAEAELQRMVEGINATRSVAEKTKEVANAMDEAASAMRRSAAISEAAMVAAQKNSETQLRAYLSVIPAGVNPLVGNIEGMGHVIVRNVGKTPAHGVRVRAHMFQTTDLNHPLWKVDPDTERPERSIQPDAEMRRGSDEKLPVEELCRPGKYIYVWGVVYYDDGYGNRRSTRFCHTYQSASFNRGREANMPIISVDKARYHHFGNDAD